MRVDESRYEDVVGQLDVLVVRKLPQSFRGWKNPLDDAVAYGDGVMLKHRARGLDRDDPAGGYELLLYLGVPWTSTTTRRLGLRHSMRFLRSFWSGQDFTGSVLPKPSVSTLAASTPFDTR